MANGDNHFSPIPGPFLPAQRPDQLTEEQIAQLVPLNIQGQPIQQQQQIQQPVGIGGGESQALAAIGQPITPFAPPPVPEGGFSASEFTAVPEPEVDIVPGPAEDVPNEISMLRSIGEEAAAEELAIGYQDTVPQEGVETESSTIFDPLFGESNILVGSNLVPEEEPLPHNFGISLEGEKTDPVNIDTVSTEIDESLISDRDGGLVNSIFDFEKTRPGLLSGLFPKRVEEFQKSDLFKSAQAESAPIRTEEIYKNTEGLAQIAGVINTIEEKLANGEYRSIQEFEEEKLIAYKEGFQTLGGSFAIVKDDFTLDEAERFFQEGLDTIDKTANKLGSFSETKVGQFQSDVNDYKNGVTSNTQYQLELREFEGDALDGLFTNIKATNTIYSDKDGNFPGGITDKQADTAQNKYIQASIKNVQEINAEMFSLKKLLNDNRQYLTEEEYNDLNSTFRIIENHNQGYTKSILDMAGLMYDTQIAGALSSTETEKQVQKHYGEQGFEGINGFLSSQLDIDQSKLKIPIVTVGSDLVTIHSSKRSQILNAFKREVYVRTEGKGVGKSFAESYNVGVTFLQQGFTDPSLDIGKNIYGNIIGLALNPSLSNQDVADPEFDNSWLERLTKMYPSLATSDLGEFSNIETDPTKKSKKRGLQKLSQDIGIDFYFGIKAAFTPIKGVNAATNYAKGIQFAQSNPILRLGAARLPQLTAAVVGDITISAGIQSSIGGIYTETDAVLDMIFLGAFDILPVVAKSIGDVNFLTMNAKMASNMAKDGKYSLAHLEYSKRVVGDMEAALYREMRKDPIQGNKKIKTAYVRAKLNEFVQGGALTDTDKANLRGMVNQLNNPNTTVLDMLNYDLIKYVDDTKGTEIARKIQIGPFSKTIGDPTIPRVELETSIIPDNLKKLGVKNPNQVFTAKQADAIAESLGKTRNEVFAGQKDNVFLLRDPKSLGIVDKSGTSNQILSDIGRDLIETKDKKISQSFYDSVGKRAEFQFKGSKMQEAGLYERVFNSMHNLLC